MKKETTPTASSTDSQQQQQQLGPVLQHSANHFQFENEEGNYNLSGFKTRGGRRKIIEDCGFGSLFDRNKWKFLRFIRLKNLD